MPLDGSTPDPAKEIADSCETLRQIAQRANLTVLVNLLSLVILRAKQDQYSKN